MPKENQFCWHECLCICFSAFGSHGLNGALDSESLAGIKEL